MNEIPKEWVDKAESDYDAAEITLRGREFETLREALQSLEQYAILIRYPGLIVPVEMAEKAFASATRIREYMREKLGLNDQ